MKKTFTFTFTGKNAENLAERFSAYYWDGGLDQYLEQEFLEEYDLSLDDTSMSEEGVVINTENAKD